jgi:hypothetical protein
VTDAERSEPEDRDDGLGPFGWFAIAGAVGAAFALFMGLAYASTPTFTTAALPTIAGVSIALAAFFLLGARSPSND